MPQSGVTKKKKICLALQGGGSHGAYTWGVLDALLEDGRLEIEGISATSAGSVNAVALASGFADGGSAKDARAMLKQIWYRISVLGAMYSPVKRMPWEMFLPKSMTLNENPTFLAFEMATRALSPYQFNPLGFNPLSQALTEEIDFEALKSSAPVHLYISATCVETGDARVFHNDEIDAEVVVASASLPFLYQAVEINGWHYWDGGFMGNPVMTPLLENSKASDVLLIQINPVIRMSTPKTSYDIENRMMEIAFNSSLEGELRNLVTLRKMRRDGWIKPEFEKKIPEVFFHSIRGDEELVDLSVASKFETEWDFFVKLHDMGRKAGKAWLADNYDKVGVADSVDYEDEFL